MKRFRELKDGDEKWLYDTKKDVLYNLIDGCCYPSKLDIIKLSKFCPYTKDVAGYDVNPYDIRK